MNTNENNHHLEESTEWSFEDYLDLALRRRWLIGIIFILIFSATLYYSLTRPPKYASAVTFSIDQQSELSGIGSKMVNPYLQYRYGNANNLQYYQALIHSQPFYQKVINDALADSALKVHGGMTSEKVLDVLSNGMTLEKEEYSNLIYLRVVAYDPVLAYRMADIISNAFKYRSRDVEQEQAQNVVEYVNSQVVEAEKNLEKAEKELQEFKSRTNFTFSGEEDGIIQRLTEIEKKITESQTKRELTQANLETYNHRLEQLEQGGVPGLWDLESPEIVQLRSSIEKLEKQKHNLLESDNTPQEKLREIEIQLEEKKYQLRTAILNAGNMGKKNSDLLGAESDDNPFTVLRKRKIDEELKLYSLQNEEKFYRQLLENYKKQHPNLLEQAVRLAKLKRAKTVAENLYSFLVQEGEQAKIRAETGTGGILVVSPPMLPEQPLPPKTTRNIAIGLFLGLGLGFGMAFVLDYFDKSIHTTEAIERHTKLSVLGTIPDLSRVRKQVNKYRKETKPEGGRKSKKSIPQNGKSAESYCLLPAMGSKNPLVEAYRNLRTDLQFVNVDEPITQMVVMSSMPGEGKTITCANLGISYAELGKSVLIVDCDMRKPMQHKVFKVQKTPGLSDFLARDDISLDMVLQQTNINNLKVLSSGTTPPNPAEMIGSLRMDDLVRRLTEEFDLIIYDTPPIMAVSDPKILAPKVGNILLVVRADRTNLPDVKNAVNRIQTVGGKIVGTVLNGVGATKGYGYYYRYNYYHDYSYYYTDDKDSKKSKKKKQSIV